MDYSINTYKHNKDNTERYVLGFDNSNPLIVIGLNPSTADDSKPDNTIRKIISIADRNGYNGFIMLNLYPVRSTDPYNLPIKCDTDAHKRNLIEIEEIFMTHRNSTLLLAFGNHLCNKKFSYLKGCLSEIMIIANKYGMKLKSLGKLSKQDCPKHPLYLKTDTPLLEYKPYK